MTASLINEDKDEVLAEKVELADSLFEKLCGLMFRWDFSDGEALLFRFSEPRKFRTHTFFVFFPIDIIFMDEEFEVLEVEEELSPWSNYSPEVLAENMVELPVGKVDDSGTEVGDVLKLG